MLAVCRGLMRNLTANLTMSMVALGMLLNFLNQVGPNGAIGRVTHLHSSILIKCSHSEFFAALVCTISIIPYGRESFGDVVFHTQSHG